MNAIKDGSLIAFRDNRNRWQIKAEHLSNWMAERTGIATVRTATLDTPSPQPPNENAIRLAVLEAELKGKDQRISDLERDRDQLERDRDSWREQAQELARRPRRWWPF